MINFNEEYFSNGCYFFLKEGKDKISLYYSVGETITESRKKDEKKDFDKKNEKKLKKYISKVISSKEKKSKEDIEKLYSISESKWAVLAYPDIPGIKAGKIIKDESDNRLLELADISKADFIITGSTNDFTMETHNKNRVSARLLGKI